jgi:hypothetical protein
MSRRRSPRRRSTGLARTRARTNPLVAPLVAPHERPWGWRDVTAFGLVLGGTGVLAYLIYQQVKSGQTAALPSSTPPAAGA